LRTSRRGLLIARELARKLHARVGDTVKLLSPLATIDPGLLGKEGALPAGDFQVVGILDMGFEEYDKRLVYLRATDAQELVGSASVVVGVELKLTDRRAAAGFARRLEKLLGGAPYRVIDWEELNHNLFTALRLQ